MSARKRIEYVDVAKGIAILCVVAGHTFAAYDLEVFRINLSIRFICPLFILSGFSTNRRSLKSFWKKGKKPSGPLFCDQCASLSGGLVSERL